MSWFTVNNEDVYEFLNRHKKDIICDLCRKRIWFVQKGIRFVIRAKDNVWVEYYHVKCLEKRGYLRKVKKESRWDKEGTNNLIH